MANKPIFTGHVKKGKLFLRDRKQFDAYIAGLTGKDIDIEVRLHRKKRTTGQEWEKSNQNGYYHGVVIPKLQEYFKVSCNMDLDHEQIHDGIKNLFLSEGLHSKFPLINSTKNLDTLQWESLMQRIRDWAEEEYHLHIPEPYEEPPR